MASSSAKAAATAAAAQASPPNLLDDVPLWDMDGPQIDQWIRSVHALFPKGECLYCTVRVVALIKWNESSF